MSARRNSHIPAIPIAMLFVCISMMFVVLGSGTSGWVRSGFWAASLVFVVLGSGRTCGVLPGFWAPSLGFGFTALMGALRSLRRVQRKAPTVPARLDDDSADRAADQ